MKTKLNMGRAWLFPSGTILANKGDESISHEEMARRFLARTKNIVEYEHVSDILINRGFIKLHYKGDMQNPEWSLPFYYRVTKMTEPQKCFIKDICESQGKDFERYLDGDYFN